MVQMPNDVIDAGIVNAQKNGCFESVSHELCESYPTHVDAMKQTNILG
jgi:hypothetical protein